MRSRRSDRYLSRLLPTGRTVASLRTLKIPNSASLNRLPSSRKKVASHAIPPESAGLKSEH
jgi:hypothetical protein